MDKLKKEDLKSYDAPETKMSQVELEDGVCAGAISMKAESPHGVSVEAQEVNTDFWK